ncbi:hypothetical protein [Streptomyces phaeochromogenes]|uniref:hypothetical protein n=1 Tax=Streptomyces phaeochromogenes TaxID=1923 RepID=UPI00386AC6FA|nr:hypothetical protein OG277_15945 [Streptomyces phaeochromogenes]
MPRSTTARLSCRQVDLGRRGLGTSAADVQPLNLTEPAFAFGLGEAGDQVAADFGEPCPERDPAPSPA